MTIRAPLRAGPQLQHWGEKAHGAWEARAGADKGKAPWEQEETICPAPNISWLWRTDMCSDKGWLYLLKLNRNT